MQPSGVLIAETLDDLISRAEVDNADAAWWYRFGLRVGRAAGYEQGRIDTEAEVDGAWSVLAERVREEARQPTYEQLRRRRGEAV